MNIKDKLQKPNTGFRNKGGPEAQEQLPMGSSEHFFHEKGKTEDLAESKVMLGFTACNFRMPDGMGSAQVTRRSVLLGPLQKSKGQFVNTWQRYVAVLTSAQP